MKPGQVVEVDGRFYLVLDVLMDGGLELQRITAMQAQQLRSAQRGMAWEYPSHG